MLDSVLVCCRPDVFQMSVGFTRDLEGCAGIRVQPSARDICENLFVVINADDNIRVYGCLCFLSMHMSVSEVERQAAGGRRLQFGDTCSRVDEVTDIP
jgi:hypothetical protein